MKTAHTLNSYQQLAVKVFTELPQLKNYRHHFTAFITFYPTKKPSPITKEEVLKYMLCNIEKNNPSPSTQNVIINSIKFFYEEVLNRPGEIYQLPRPQKENKLPTVFDETEIAAIIKAAENLKHKTMLCLAYSGGLRVSEIVSLKIQDVHSKRMVINIRQAKGKKDRYVNLSPVLLDILRKYIQEYKPAPKEWLFESEQTGSAYPTRTVQQIFSNAKKQAAIKKEVGVHSLRHSFATHLLDKGTDIKYIKELLGHFNIKTTERYLYVSHQKLVNIISPLDDLMGKESIEW